MNLPESLATYCARRADEETDIAARSADESAARVHAAMASSFRAIAEAAETDFRLLPPLRPLVAIMATEHAA